jgi:hypothetical protein
MNGGGQHTAGGEFVRGAALAVAGAAAAAAAAAAVGTIGCAS